MRADGFKPNTEAIGERMVQLKGIDKALPGLAAQANILALCAKGTMSYDKLAESHASRAKRLAKTKVVGAISAGKGAAARSKVPEFAVSPRGHSPLQRLTRLPRSVL